MVAELDGSQLSGNKSCSLAKISMVAELCIRVGPRLQCCSLAKISMVAERVDDD